MSIKNKTAHQRNLLACGGVFFLALVIRLIYLYQISGNPTFYYPVIDAEVYDRLARTLIRQKEFTEQFFWQPFFYPLFLSKVYLLTKGSILAAKIFQAMLGASTCLVVYMIGKKIDSLRTAVIAGMIAALYGPMIFFEEQLLATGWACFWAAALILALIVISEKKSAFLIFITGVISGLAFITRPTFLLFLPVGFAWLVLLWYKQKTNIKQIVVFSLLFASGFLLISGSVAVLKFNATGSLNPLPGSGGINLHIGNNLQREDTVSIRPMEWKEFTRLPRFHGSTNQHQDSQYFMQQFKNYVKEDPADFIKGLSAKSLEFISSREIPRNVDLYTFREYSRLLSGLTWKWKGFGFPFGILLPVAIFGLICCRPRIPGVIYLFIAVYSVSIVLVFVSCRYRLPVIPILSVAAAMGLQQVYKMIRGIGSLKLLACSALTVLFISACFLPGPFAGEDQNYKAEMYYIIGAREREDGNYDKAIANLSRAIEYNGDFQIAYSAMGLVLSETGQHEKAMEYHEKAIAMDPAYGKSYFLKGLSLAKQQRHQEAINQYKKAIELNPYIENAYYNWGKSLVETDRMDEAIEHYKKTLEIIPRQDLTANFAWILATHPDEKIRNGKEALYFAKKACELSNNEDPWHLYILAAGYAEIGEFGEAVDVAYGALEIAGAGGEMRQKIEYGLSLFKQQKTLRGL